MLPSDSAMQKFLERLLSRSALDPAEQQAILNLPCNVLQMRAAAISSRQGRPFPTPAW